MTAGWKSVDYFSALAQVGSLALYYEMTDARNLELNKIANEIVNEYMVLELKEGYKKFPPASHSLAQIIFPTECTAGLLEGLRHALRQ